MAAIVRKAAAKWKTVTRKRLLSTCVVRKLGERKEVNTLKRYLSMKKQIAKEWQVTMVIEGDCPYDDDDRRVSHDFEDLKGFLKDLRQFNRDNQHKMKKDADKILEKRRMIKDIIDSGAHRRTGAFHPGPLPPTNLDLKIAHRTILNYNKHQHLNLQFARLISVHRNIYPSRRNLVVEAYNPDAAGVPMKVEAVYSRFAEKLLKYKASLPVPFMRVKNLVKKAERQIEGVDVEPLLFANFKHCPIIKKRLGLKIDENKDKDKDTDVYEMVSDLVPRGQVTKLPKDDDTVNSIASSAVKQQKKRLKFVRVTKAWLERILKDQLVYHIMLEAMKAKVKTLYYAAVKTNGGKRKEGKCIDWVTADSPRPTMPLPS